MDGGHRSLEPKRRDQHPANQNAARMASSIASPRGVVIHAQFDLIRPKIDRFLRRDGVWKPLEHLRERFPPESEMFILGGALRNIIVEHFHGRTPPTADVDIFVGNLPSDFDLSRRFSRETSAVTELGGIRWRPENSPFSFDLCALDRFFNIEKYKLPPTLENLLAGTDFSVNAIVFDVKSEEVVERNAVEAIQRKTIDFNTDRFLTKNLLLYRILVMRHKLEFLLSRRVYNFVKSETNIDALSTLKGTLRSKLGKDTSKAVLLDCDRINRYSDYPEYITSEWKRIHGARP